MSSWAALLISNVAELPVVYQCLTPLAYESISSVALMQDDTKRAAVTEATLLPFSRAGCAPHQLFICTYAHCPFQAWWVPTHQPAPTLVSTSSPVNRKKTAASSQITTQATWRCA